jgi:hypothetical protein
MPRDKVSISSRHQCTRLKCSFGCLKRQSNAKYSPFFRAILKNINYLVWSDPLYNRAGVKDVTSRLEKLLMDEGIDTEVLRYTVNPEKREEWIKDKVDSGVQAVIANPKLVQTGLDLYAFPTMIFYQTGYSIFTLRQASRRSWRIGQDKDVKIYYLFYGSTMQEKAMHLMGSKLEAALAIEGKFSEEGLSKLRLKPTRCRQYYKQIWAKLRISNFKMQSANFKITPRCEMAYGNLVPICSSMFNLQFVMDVFINVTRFLRS